MAGKSIVAIIGPDNDTRCAIAEALKISPLACDLQVVETVTDILECDLVVHLPVNTFSPDPVAEYTHPVIQAAKFAAGRVEPHIVVSPIYDYRLSVLAIGLGASLVIPASAASMIPYFASQVMAKVRVPLPMPSLEHARSLMAALLRSSEEASLAN